MKTIFYSWQSDLPNNTNRGFIKDCLDKAIKELMMEGAIAVEPRVDQGAQGLPGSPDIADAIFAKIDTCSMFVCDVSFINGKTDDGETCKCTRPCPNPNVIGEWGRATKSVGFERIMCVFNTAFGKVEDLPFDMRKRLIATYYLKPDDEKSEIRKGVVRQFKGAIQAVMEIPQVTLQVEFADLKTKKSLGPEISVAGKLVIPPFDIPDYCDPPIDLPEGAKGFASILRTINTSPFQSRNPRYLRQKANYLYVKNLLRPVAFVVQNNGTATADHVTLQFTVPRMMVIAGEDGVESEHAGGLLVTHEDDYEKGTKVPKKFLSSMHPDIDFPSVGPDSVLIETVGSDFQVTVEFG